MVFASQWEMLFNTVDNGASWHEHEAARVGHECDQRRLYRRIASSVRHPRCTALRGRQGPQILIDRLQVAIGHVGVDHPGHDL